MTFYLILYHFIFIANCLNEMESNAALNLVEKLSELITDDGAIIIAEPVKLYSNQLIRALSQRANDMGLNVFYPCSNRGCPYNYKHECWVWRYHEYSPFEILVDGQALEPPRDNLVCIWLILTKKQVTIYDPFISNRLDLTWGPVSRERKQNRAICSNANELTFVDESLFSYYKRGHIVGISSDGIVEDHFEI